MKKQILLLCLALTSLCSYAHTDAPFTEILQTLEKRYDVTINHTMNIPASKQYTVRFLKNENLEEILSVLSEMIGFSYQKQGNKVELIKKQ